MLKDTIIPPTCPVIDGAIHSLQAVDRVLEWLEKQLTEEQQARLSDARMALHCVYVPDPCFMDQLRTANTQLRERGDDWKAEAEELKDEVLDLRRQIDDEQKRTTVIIESLQNKVSDLRRLNPQQV